MISENASFTGEASGAFGLCNQSAPVEVIFSSQMPAHELE